MSIECHVLAPLRAACPASVPSGLLSRQQAWGLAHASDQVASTDGEMVDPWDADDGAALGSNGSSDGCSAAEAHALRAAEADARCEWWRLCQLAHSGAGQSDLQAQVDAAQSRAVELGRRVNALLPRFSGLATRV